MKEILSSILLIGMGAYGIILYSTNKLSLYIHPRFFEESFVASIVALVMGVLCFSYFIVKNKNQILEVKNFFNKKLISIVFLILLSFLINSLFLVVAAFLVFAPNKNFNQVFKNDIFGSLIAISMVGIGILLPPKSLSSITASQRSIDLNSINLTQNTLTAVQNFNKSTANYSLGDWIAMQGFNPDPEFYKDKDVKISGFLYKPDNLNLGEDVYLIARFVITCCAVDARPVGLKVLLENNKFNTDEWLEVTGKFNLDSNGELIINPEKVESIDEPDNPYIF